MPWRSLPGTESMLMIAVLGVVKPFLSGMETTMKIQIIHNTDGTCVTSLSGDREKILEFHDLWQSELWPEWGAGKSRFLVDKAIMNGSLFLNTCGFKEYQAVMSSAAKLGYSCEEINRLIPTASIS